MTNPWLAIPLADYEQHMALPNVGQAKLLADAFAESLQRHQPGSVAIVGCAGGNGFERLIGSGARRVVGIDVNESYVQHAEQRFSGRIPGLELIVADVEKGQFAFEPVDLVFAGLLFEYVDVDRALSNIRSMVRVDGVLTAVLQLPSDVPSVTPSPYRSLGLLAPVLRLVPPETFAHCAARCGFSKLSSRIVAAERGKRFFVQDLVANGGDSEFLKGCLMQALT